MPVALLFLLLAALLTQYPAAAAPRAQAPGSPAASGLDFEFFRTKVQPILLAKREGHTRCVSCHSKGTPMRLQELSPGATSWNEEQARMNFRVIQSRVVPNNLTSSKLLLHPLLAEGEATSTTAEENIGIRSSIRSGRRSPTGCAGGKQTRNWSS